MDRTEIDQIRRFNRLITRRLGVLNDGVIVGHGPTAEMAASDDPFVRQFLHAQPDGPVRFHVPARPIADDLDLTRRAAS